MKYMSPFRMLNNCGNSSKRKRRIHLPTRVQRGSSRMAGASVLLRSAPTFIERNLKIVKCRPFSPTRVCRRMAGPSESRRIRRAVMSMIGDATINAMTAKKIENVRLRKSLTEDLLKLRENNNKLMLNAPSQTLPVSSSRVCCVPASSCSNWVTRDWACLCAAPAASNWLRKSEATAVCFSSSALARSTSAGLWASWRSKSLPHLVNLPLASCSSVNFWLSSWLALRSSATCCSNCWHRDGDY